MHRPYGKEKRQVSFLPPIFTFDTPKKQRFDYFFFDPSFLEVGVSVTTGSCCRSTTSFSTLCIQDSQHHHKLFKSIGRHYFHMRSTACQYNANMHLIPNFSLKLLNTIVRMLQDPHLAIDGETQHVIKQIRHDLGVDYHLPLSFKTFTLNYKRTCLFIINSGVVRCFTKVESRTLRRLSTSFKCVLLSLESPQTNSKSLFNKSKAARNFENRVLKKPSTCWPYTSTNNYLPELLPRLKVELKKYGAAILPLENTPVLVNHFRHWNDHLKKIMGVPSQTQLSFFDPLQPLPAEYKYRNMRQHSTHFPRFHGRTQYGHFLASNLQLFKQIEPVVATAFKSMYDDVLFTVLTAEINIQMIQD
jgi:hypothetical protein